MNGWLLALILLAALALAAAWPVWRERRRTPITDALRRQAPGKFARLSGGMTHYRWLGPARGPVAVCVHGLTTPSDAYLGVAEGLARLGYRILIYDLYGRGYSDRPSTPQDAAHFHLQLSELLEHEGLQDDLTVFGYSMGGMIAAGFAAAHPERIRRLVLLAPAGIEMAQNGFWKIVRGWPWLGDWLFLALFPRFHRRGTEAERPLPKDVPGIVDIQQAELRRQGFVPAVLSSLRGMLSADMEHAHRELHRARVPVVAIWGREDTVIPISAMGRLAKWNRTALQEVVEGAGHGLPYTHAEAVTKIFADAVRQPVI